MLCDRGPERNYLRNLGPGVERWGAGALEDRPQGVRHPGQPLPQPRFIETKVNTTAPHDELADAGTRWVLVDPGRSYVAYVPPHAGFCGSAFPFLGGCYLSGNFRGSCPGSGPQIAAISANSSGSTCFSSPALNG